LTEPWSASTLRFLPWSGRVDLYRVGEVADPDAAFAEVVDQIEGVSDSPAQPVEAGSGRHAG
jgi:hypothetical protein